VADQYRVSPNAPLPLDVFLDRFRREVEVSLRLHPESLPWKRSTDFGRAGIWMTTRTHPACLAHPSSSSSHPLS
jgi:hypothetical protein